MKQRFDAILIDAPCTGTGALARRPDLRWRRTLNDVVNMAKIQLGLLRYAAELTTPKGRIIYSTCSIEPEENEAVITEFLSKNTDFRLAPAGNRLPVELVDKDGQLSVIGNEINGDGVFAARLERVGT